MIKRLLTMLPVLLLCTGASAASDHGIRVRHFSNEQNIIELRPVHRYLLLPVEDSAPEGRLFFVQDNTVSGPGINVRLARERIDYYVPLDISEYHGENLQIDVQAVPEGSVCWKNLSCSDDFTADVSPVPAYHHIPP